MQANCKYFILSKWLYLNSDVHTTLHKYALLQCNFVFQTAAQAVWRVSHRASTASKQEEDLKNVKACSRESFPITAFSSNKDVVRNDNFSCPLMMPC